MKFSIYQESRTGGRKYNQDRVGYVFSRESLFMVVADGMGGHLNGEVAAQITVEHMGRKFQQEAKPTLSNPMSFLGDAINGAHQAILGHAEKHGMLETPRTTVVAAIIQKGAACWAHVGDSRLYLLRDGQVATKTLDHSHVQQLVQKGIVREEAVASHPDRNKIFNCLGAHIPPRIELSAKHALKTGDTLLLCSDGLWGPLPPRQLASAFMNDALAKAVPALMTQAEQRAGKDADNVTALAMTWNEDENAPGGISTLTLPAGEFNSHMDASSSAAEGADLSEDDIEKAISEIRRALAKSNPPRG
jgi:serine/threonine protein phosphatase PrpC